MNEKKSHTAEKMNIKELPVAAASEKEENRRQYTNMCKSVWVYEAASDMLNRNIVRRGAYRLYNEPFG